MAQTIFKRCEKKFLLTEGQYQAVKPLIERYMLPDRFTNYPISNIYLDTRNFDLIRLSLGKPKYKEKLRVRFYGTAAGEDSRVFVEIKKKFDGVVYKRRVEMSLEEARDYLEGDIYPAKDSQILREITLGEGKSGDIALLEEICSAAAELADCSLTRDAAAEILRLLREQKESFESHISRRRCPAVVCGRLTFVYIDPTKCTGSDACTALCPERAIEGGPDMIHIIVPELCTGCGKCMAACGAGAIQRIEIAGVKPKLPEEPVPVGSFKAVPAPGKGLRKGLRKH